MVQRLALPLASYMAPIVLVALACWQIYLAHTHGLTPWKGGGFGMFSTVDSVDARFLRIYLITGEGETPVEAPYTPAMERLITRLRAFPSQPFLNALAVELAGQTWVPLNYDPFAVFEDTPPEARKPQFRVKYEGEPEPAAADAIRVEGVRVELWRYQFEPSSRQIQADLFLQSIYPIHR